MLLADDSRYIHGHATRSTVMATNTLGGLKALLQELKLDEIPEFPSADILHHPTDIFHVYLADAVQKILGCDPKKAYDAIQPANSSINGDLAIVLPRLKVPDGPGPEKLGEDLLAKFPYPHPLFSLPWKDGIHIRVFWSLKALPRIIVPFILDRGSHYGCSIDGASQVVPPEAAAETAPEAPPSTPIAAVDPPKHLSLAEGGDTYQKTVVVEFSSPNLGPDFRADHLRSTVLGAFVANIYDAMGWNVVRISYLGDWGMHIGLLGIGWSRWGSLDTLNDHPEPLRYLHDLYARMDEEMKPVMEAKKKAREKGDTASDGGADEEGLIAERDATFKKLEDGDDEAVELWERLHKISVDYYKLQSSRLDIMFDDFKGESQVCLGAKFIQTTEESFKAKNLSEKAEDGSWVLDFGKHDAARLRVATVRGKHGTSTYFLRDVAAVLVRLADYRFDKMIYVVGEQDEHFRQVFKAVELLGHAKLAASLQHLTFRRNPTKWGEQRLLGDILDECIRWSHRGTDDPSLLPPLLRDMSASSLSRVAINSLKLSELNTKNKSPSTGLDAEKLMSSEGETGLGLEVLYRRLENCIVTLQEDATVATGGSGDRWPEPEFLSLADSPWIDLIRRLAQFPEIMATAYKTLEPQGLVEYLFEVLDDVKYCLDETSEGLAGIEGEGEMVAAKRHARLMLFRAALQVVKNAMGVLNIR
ncbi:hypothetical protein QBC47DRAFT_392076 [Echria macrotheca]|uniref:arginine--tRNA ligase n=1 Tax=Echria macrotheca TaxID=438768 RepID=A0AAJ0B3H7_9PEZI|nr:hypothetical protein QBC47DRAFT_392076 [Echria macrotheca]